MGLCAFLIDNTVVKVEETSEQSYLDQINQYQMIVDVSNLVVPPEKGWILSGNSIVPGPGQMVNIKDIIKNKIKLYQSLAPELLRDLYATNTLLGITVEQSDAMFDEYSDVILRLDQGAFPSAIHRLQQKTPSGFVTQEMIDAWVAKIQALMV